MFGFLKPGLDSNGMYTYQKYYCGLCTGTQRYTGLLSRIFINYDICMAYLIADSLYMEDHSIIRRCPFAPWKSIQCRDNPELLEYLSRLNYILVYHKILDDISDENKWAAKLAEKIMHKKYIVLTKKCPKMVRIMSSHMDVIHDMERECRFLPVKEAAVPFGDLLGDIMHDLLPDPSDEEVFSLFCRYLGKWIYIVDACTDLLEDEKNNNYNPILAGMEGTADRILEIRKEEILAFLIECSESMQYLLKLMSCAKNEELIISMLNHLLPNEIAEKLR